MTDPDYLFEPILSQSFQFLEGLFKHYGKLAIIIDSCLFDRLPLKSKDSCILIPLQASEERKTRETCAQIQDQLLQWGLQKRHAIVAVGGGITLDLSGFVASTYLRGVDCYYVPTTLLAMVDAAFGGKTGVNTPFGKNLIGTIYFPKKVLIDLDFLKSLSPTDQLSGIAEMIKYGITLDPAVIDELLIDPFHPRLIQRCIDIKLSIVRQDTLDRNIRHILNFGHTIGHALEAASHYRIPHGIAVFQGMLIESSLADHFRSKIDLLNRLQTHFQFPFLHELEWDRLIFKQALAKDKKAISSLIPIVSNSRGEITEFSIETILSSMEALDARRNPS
jgi:3-dehydroquinate synthase